LALKNHCFYLDQLLSKPVPLSKLVYCKAELFFGHTPIHKKLRTIELRPEPKLWLYVGSGMKRQRVTNYYSGHVQGVGFRYRVKNLATGFEVTGTIKNLGDGRVKLVAEGTKIELEAFLVAIRDSEIGRFIRGEAADWAEAINDFRGFEIIS
jgi:acylphosphatase